MNSTKYDRQSDIITDGTMKKPIRCLIWGTGKTFRDFYYVIKYYEMIGDILIYGITSNDAIFDALGDYRFVNKDSIDPNCFDVIIIMSTTKASIDEITTEAHALGVSGDNIISCRVLRLFGFDILKYLKLKKRL